MIGCHELMGKSWRDYLFFTLVLILACSHSKVQGSACHLPAEWEGQWFQQGFDTPLLITNSSIGNKGNCEDRSGDDLFLFNDQSAEGSCYRCLVIIPRHENVLQYKESAYCEEKNTLGYLCQNIPGDANLHTLFRMNAQRIECPFENTPFVFTYNKGGGDCQDPVSHVDTCTENSRLLLRYEACHDLRSTESYEEELQCLATWRDSSRNYLSAQTHKSRSGLALYEDTFRCFVYEKVENSTTGQVVGYRVSQSGDDQASCEGLSLGEAAQTMTFFKAENSRSECHFPSWLGSEQWNSLDRHRQIKVEGKSTLVGNFSDFLTHEQRVNGLERSAVQVQFQCQSLLKDEDNYVALVAKQVTGCKQVSVCMRIYKRTEIVMQIQRTEVPRNMEGGAICDERLFGHVPFETYVIESLSPPKPCPIPGKLRLTDVTGNGRPDGVYSVEMGCEEAEVVRVKSISCWNETCSAEFQCHDSWTEQSEHMIASSLTNDSVSGRALYCLSYTVDGDGFRLTASNASCPGLKTEDSNALVFTGTLEGSCREQANSAASLLWSTHISALLCSISCVHFSLLVRGSD